MLVEAERFEACFVAWTRAVFTPTENGSPRQIAVDGKVMRRLSYDFLSFCAKQEPQISTFKILICGGGWIVCRLVFEDR